MVDEGSVKCEGWCEVEVEARRRREGKGKLWSPRKKGEWGKGKGGCVI